MTLRSILLVLALATAAIAVPVAAARTGCDTAVVSGAVSIQKTRGAPSGACAGAGAAVPVPAVVGVIIVGAGGGVAVYDPGYSGVPNATDANAGAGVWYATLDFECWMETGDPVECMRVYCLAVCVGAWAATRDRNGDHAPDAAYTSAGSVVLP